MKQAFNVISVNHTSYTVTDMDGTIRFFIECLGMELELRAPLPPHAMEQLVSLKEAEVEQAFVKGHGYRIELLSFKSPADRQLITARSCDTGAVHLGVYVDNTRAAVAAAATYGFYPLGELVAASIPGHSKAIAWVNNADGVTVEFLEPVIPKN